MGESNYTQTGSLAELFAEGTSIEKEIVEELLSEANLDRKTELNKPLSWAALTVLEEFFQDNELPKTRTTINRFTDFAFRYLISYKRKGRAEYVQALQSLRGMADGLGGDKGVPK